MPIEIKELHIRINVNESNKTVKSNAPVDVARIVEESVEQMAEVLKQQKER